MTFYQIFTDGGSRGNPGEAGIGLVIFDGSTGEIVKQLGDYLGQTTNNVAEYSALIRALQIARELGGEKIEVYADSELMIKQLNGQYKVKSEGLIPLYQQVKQLSRGFQSCQFTHVLRGKNKLADELANLAMDKKGTVEGEGQQKKSSKAGKWEHTRKTEVTGKAAQGQLTLEAQFADSLPFRPTGKLTQLAPGIFRETIGRGEKMLQLRVYLQKGSELPKHQHPHEQISFVFFGRVRFTTPDGDKELTAGQTLVFPGNQEHGAMILEDSIVLDTFSPVRKEYL